MKTKTPFRMVALRLALDVAERLKELAGATGQTQTAIMEGLVREARLERIEAKRVRGAR